MKKFILVGCGSWGARWYKDFIPEVSDTAQCVAVCDLDPEAVKAAGEALGLPEECRYTNVTKAFSEHKVDFAAVAASINSHLPVVRAILAVQPACHILSEKPVAGSLEDCIEFERVIRRYGVRCAFTFSHRYERDKQTLESVLASGKYGKINSIVCRLIVRRPPKKTSVSNILTDGGVHYVDMLQHYSGSTWKNVFAQTWECPWQERDASSYNAFLLAEMRNGVHTALEITLGSADDRNGWCNENFRVECEKACLELDRGRLFTLHTGDDGTRYREELPVLQGAHWKHDLIIRKFISWIDGGPEPDISLDNAMQAMRFLYAAVSSAETGAVAGCGPYCGH